MRLLPGGVRAIYRVVTASLLVAWWARGHAVVDLYANRLSVVQVRETYFPGWLAEARLLPWLYIVPSVLGLIGLLRPLRALAIAHTSSLVVCSFGMLVHQSGHAFQGANTAFWAGAFLLWMCNVSEQSFQSVRLRALLLLQLILGMIFLGGASGKWTHAYWNGEAMFHLMFLYQDAFSWTWLREHFSLEELRGLATSYSRLVVMVESALATLPLWPARWAFRVAPFAVLGMWLGATPRIVDAVGPVFGMAVAGWLLTRTSAEGTDVA